MNNEERNEKNARKQSRSQRHSQQANPGDVEPGQGDDRHEPNPGNRKASGEREQVDLPEPGDRESRSRNVDRGTH